MRTILVISDTHVGSVWGMLPPRVTTASGHAVQQNYGQRWLWHCWTRMLHRLPRIDILVLLGDLVDGRQYRQRQTESCLVSVADQADAAYRILSDLRSRNARARIFVVSGTEYHDGIAAEELEALAARLGAEQYTGIGAGRYCKEVLDLSVGGVVINFSHGIGVSGGLYRATPADREGVWSALAGKEGRAPRADCLVRAHAHHFVHLEHASKHIIVNPCWQLQTRFMRRNSAYRMLPDIGCTLLEVRPAVKKAGGDPITVHKILFPLPPFRLTEVP